jgi:hypothetical protein
MHFRVVAKPVREESGDLWIGMEVAAQGDLLVAALQARWRLASRLDRLAGAPVNSAAATEWTAATLTTGGTQQRRTHDF